MGEISLESGLGPDLRTLRRARGLTQGAAARHLDRSVGWMSQVERGLSAPTAQDVQSLAALYGVPVSMILGPQTEPREAGRIVRATARRPIGPRAQGLSEALLSPDLTDDFEVIHATFAPGAALPEPRQRATQEIGVLISGQLTLWIEEDRFDLYAGDSFRIRGEPYRWANPATVPAVTVWVISPPIY